ncbi:MAG: hypothetical protein WBG70_01680 [Spirulinaceae cyanobacterium]
MPRRRDNPKFTQVSGYIQKELAISFKIACQSLGLSFAQGIEQSIKLWLKQQKKENQ